MNWKLKAIGNAKGQVTAAGAVYPLASGGGELCFSDDFAADEIEIVSERGKFADSQDSFLYLYTEIDPCKENMELSARFEVLESDMIPDRQTGYGILAADTAFSGDESIEGKECRHRNHLLCGRFRTAYGMDHGYGLRAVGGYSSPAADEYTPVRSLDPTRAFGEQEKTDDICPSDICYFRLGKNDEGFSASMRKDADGEWESISFPGCDCLMQQDRERIAIGIAVAGKIRLKVSDISVKKTSGRSSRTPEDAFRCVIPDYPFLRNLFCDTGPAASVRQSHPDTVLYVSPGGIPSGAGTMEDPLDLHTAFSIAGEGTELILLDGIYQMKAPVYLGTSSGGAFQKKIHVHAEHPRRAVLDGSGLNVKAPLVVLRGRYWNLEGLVFQNSPLPGILICGSGNLIRNCEARRNGDTGILICAYPGEDRDRWPSYNSIEDCDSWDNCDPFRCNADGFGAKLSVGKGNVFFRCVAHHNIDDGFDLYTKSILGPVEPVLLDQCIAYENGRTLEGGCVRPEHSGGTGFKLGGERQPVAHELWNCLAFLNEQCGISSNSNPLARLHRCTSLCNGTGEPCDNFRHYKADGSGCRMENLFPPISGRLRKLAALPRLGSFAGDLEHGVRPLRNDQGELIMPWSSAGVRGQRSGAVIGTGRKQSLLFMISTLGGGGAERVTTILASEFSKRCQVCLLHLNRNNRRYPVAEGVKVIDCSAEGNLFRKLFHIRFSFPFKAFAVLRVKRRYHIDTTVSMLHKPNRYNSLIRWRDRRIMSERNDPSRKPENEFRDAKKNYAAADHVVFQSERVKGLFSEKIQEKSTIIRNPIAVSCYADRHPKKRIVTVGRYARQKNHDLLIRAFANFRQSHPDYTLHLYGDGELRDHLRSLIDEMHLEKEVFLEGFRDDIHGSIRDARMFVLSSDYEGMSNALMEAMMMGLPCISTACTGSDELIEHEKTGLLVPVNDEQALAFAMGRLAEDEELCRRLSDQAQLCSLDYTVDRVIRAWERIL